MNASKVWDCIQYRRGWCIDYSMVVGVHVVMDVPMSNIETSANDLDIMHILNESSCPRGHLDVYDEGSQR
jgi:hypothetical protein